MYATIPITSAKTANTDIEIPGVEAIEITKAYKSTGSDGSIAAAYTELTVDAKGDGNASAAGHIRLQADGKKFRVGDDLDASDSIILYYTAEGEAIRA
ncbi:hypothetical protein DRN97_05045 [Methanosarcinales archaeon]|nr:MAG: hypothetical protein DRN97_05045 [Methanosarcinales archaeon]